MRRKRPVHPPRAGQHILLPIAWQVIADLAGDLLRAQAEIKPAARHGKMRTLMGTLRMTRAPPRRWRRGSPRSPAPRSLAWQADHRSARQFDPHALAGTTRPASDGRLLVRRGHSQGHKQGGGPRLVPLCSTPPGSDRTSPLASPSVTIQPLPPDVKQWRRTIPRAGKTPRSTDRFAAAFRSAVARPALPSPSDPCSIHCCEGIVKPLPA